MNHNNICKWIQICQLWLNPRIHNDALIRQLGKCEFWWLVCNVKDSRSKNGNWSYVFKIILIFKTCMQPILNIHRFSICGSLCSLKFTSNPKINTLSVFVVIHRYVKNGKSLESPTLHIPRWGWSRGLCLLDSSFRLYTNALSVVYLMSPVHTFVPLFVSNFTT